MKINRISIFLAAVLVFSTACNPYKIEIPHWPYEDPDWVEKKNRVTHTIGGARVEQKLYVGWGDDAVLVWDRDWETEDFHKAYSDIWDVETQVRSE